MIIDENIQTGERFAQNIAFYNTSISNKDEIESLKISILNLEKVLDELLKYKLSQVSKTAQIPDMSYYSKVDLCYKMELLKGDLREILQLFSIIVDELSTNSIQGYESKEVQENILRLCELNQNDIFSFVIKLINLDERMNKNYNQVNELLEDIGWSGTLKFICSIIYASLVESFVDIKR